MKDGADDLLASEGAILLLHGLDDDFGDGAFLVAPFGKGVDAATNQDKTGVLNELVVNSLSSNVLAPEIRGGNGLRDVGKMHRRAVPRENNVDLVADILGVDSRPFGQAPEAVQAGELTRERGDSGDVVGMLVVKALV